MQAALTSPPCLWSSMWCGGRGLEELLGGVGGVGGWWLPLSWWCWWCWCMSASVGCICVTNCAIPLLQAIRISVKFVSEMYKTRTRIFTTVKEQQKFREDLRHLHKYFHLFTEAGGNYELIITYFFGIFLLIISAGINVYHLKLLDITSKFRSVTYFPTFNSQVIFHTEF